MNEFRGCRQSMLDGINASEHAVSHQKTVTHSTAVLEEGLTAS